MAINRLESLEREFQKNPDFVKLYHDQIEEYIFLAHARQLTKEEAKSSSEIKNYIPHHTPFKHKQTWKGPCGFRCVCKVSQYVT